MKCEGGSTGLTDKHSRRTGIIQETNRQKKLCKRPTLYPKPRLLSEKHWRHPVEAIDFHRNHSSKRRFVVMLVPRLVPHAEEMDGHVLQHIGPM